jgi:hypothetical protein
MSVTAAMVGLTLGLGTHVGVEDEIEDRGSRDVEVVDPPEREAGAASADELGEGLEAAAAMSSRRASA